jgi:hypothetical protein
MQLLKAKQFSFFFLKTRMPIFQRQKAAVESKQKTVELTVERGPNLFRERVHPSGLRFLCMVNVTRYGHFCDYCELQNF